MCCGEGLCGSPRSAKRNVATAPAALESGGVLAARPRMTQMFPSFRNGCLPPRHLLTIDRLRPISHTVLRLGTRERGFMSFVEYFRRELAQRLVRACSTTCLIILYAYAPRTEAQLQGTVYLHSGELQTGAVDLDAGGRAGWNVVIER